MWWTLVDGMNKIDYAMVRRRWMRWTRIWKKVRWNVTNEVDNVTKARSWGQVIMSCVVNQQQNTNFELFCLFLTFLPFFWKISCMPLLSKIGHVTIKSNQKFKHFENKNFENFLILGCKCSILATVALDFYSCVCTTTTSCFKIYSM